MCVAHSECIACVLLIQNVLRVYCSFRMCCVCIVHSECVACVLLIQNVLRVYCSFRMCCVCIAHSECVTCVLLIQSMLCVYCSFRVCVLCVACVLLIQSVCIVCCLCIAHSVCIVELCSKTMTILSLGSRPFRDCVTCTHFNCTRNLVLGARSSSLCKFEFGKFAVVYSRGS